MGTRKNKKTKSSKNTSSKIHESRTTVKRSRRARAKEFSRKSYIFAKKTVLTVIIVAMLAVVLAVLASSFMKPENIVKNKISEVAKDYYENYFYDKILEYKPAGQTMTEAMERYVKNGFSEVQLRQLMLFDGRRHAEAEAILYTYCDPDATTVHFYPEEPFGKTDYRVEYKYACIF